VWCHRYGRFKEISAYALCRNGYSAAHAAHQPLHEVKRAVDRGKGDEVRASVCMSSHKSKGCFDGHKRHH
jgi:hypothetical protein